MVAGKVKVAMGLQKSPAPPTPPPSSATKSSFHKSRSFAAYFPRSSAQVQPRPPDVTHLLRLVEELREREYRLKTELLEHKLLKETVAIVPLLENQIITMDTHIERNAKIMEEMEAENQRLRKEVEELKLLIEEEKRQEQRKTKALEDEIAELKKTASEGFQNDEQRFQGLVEVSVKSNLIKSLKKTASDQGSGNQKQVQANVTDFKREVVEREREMPRHSPCDSDELADSTDSVLTRPRAPRVPKPPPRPSSSSPHSLSTGSSDSARSENNNVETEEAISQPPKLGPPPPPPPPSKAAPPPPPPLPKGNRQDTAKVRRVPEVVEFYHSLMKRESQSRRDSSSGVAEIPSTANARDMIGEIENRSSHLLAVSVCLAFVEIAALPLAVCVSVKC